MKKWQIVVWIVIILLSSIVVHEITHIVHGTSMGLEVVGITILTPERPIVEVEFEGSAEVIQTYLQGAEFWAELTGLIYLMVMFTVLILIVVLPKEEKPRRVMLCPCINGWHIQQACQRHGIMG